MDCQTAEIGPPDLVDEETRRNDERYMRMALDEAAQAALRGEVPVGAVLVRDGEVVARGHNLRETAQDPTAHAELAVIRAASARYRTWRLEDMDCYVTLEPCLMCAGALVVSRVRRVIWGCDDPKGGGMNALGGVLHNGRVNHRVEVHRGVLADECASLLSGFFKEIRRRPRF